MKALFIGVLLLGFAAALLGAGLQSVPESTVKITPTPTRTPSPTPIPLPALVPGQRALDVPILLYHYVGDNPNPQDSGRETLSVPPGVFEQQLRTLRDNGYTSISLDELADALEGKGAIPAFP